MSYATFLLQNYLNCSDHTPRFVAIYSHGNNYNESYLNGVNPNKEKLELMWDTYKQIITLI